MSNETINPIHHSTLGGATGTVAGAAGGMLKSGFKALAFTVGAGVLVGALWGAGVFAGVGIAGGTIINTLLGGALGGVLGFGASYVTAPIAGTIGAISGGTRAADRIRDEKGAANMLDAQLSAYQSQAQAMQTATTIYAPSAANNNSFPASTMNQAGTRIQADTAQNLGTINGLALQRA